MVARNLKSSFALLTGAVVGLTLGTTVGGPATAQPAGASGDANAPESIVVTARRREESLQDTPVAVTVLNVEALEERQIVATTDLDKVAPNLQFHSYGTLTGNNSAAQVFIRGVGQTD